MTSSRVTSFRLSYRIAIATIACRARLVCRFRDVLLAIRCPAARARRRWGRRRHRVQAAESAAAAVPSESRASAVLPSSATCNLPTLALCARITLSGLSRLVFVCYYTGPHLLVVRRVVVRRGAGGNATVYLRCVRHERVAVD